jgi:hypothetical protein
MHGRASNSREYGGPDFSLEFGVLELDPATLTFEKGTG